MISEIEWESYSKKQKENIVDLDVRCYKCGGDKYHPVSWQGYLDISKKMMIFLKI